MKQLLIYPVIVFTLVSAMEKIFAQPVPTWDDIRTGDSQLPVYVPPPAAFFDNTRSASFSINYTGFSGQSQASFQYASTIWSAILNSPVPIKVNAVFVPLTPGLLGITLPNGRKDFAGTPQPDTWYATALANSIAGIELNPGEADFDLYLNSTINWYFGVDGNCPGSKYDFVSIVLHEMCHGLGFVGLAKVEGTTGSFGLLQATDFAPIVTSFPWPLLDSLPGIYDTKLEEAGGTLLTSYANPSAELNTIFTGNQVYFDGEHAISMNGGVKPRMYAPSTFALGSSLLHLNESTYPAGNINELMTPFAGASNAVHDPGPIVMGILQDIGWSVNYNVGIENNTERENAIVVFPNPVHDEIHLLRQGQINPSPEQLEISDVYGRIVMKYTKIPATIDGSVLPAGLYLLQIVKGNKKLQTNFIKY